LTQSFYLGKIDYSAEAEM